MFDLSLPKLLVLAVLALVVFGPDELPKIAAQAGRALRDLRRIAESAKSDLREGLGPELAGLEIEDLDPKRLARRYLSGDLNADPAAPQRPAANGTPVTPGKHPPSGPDGTGPHGADQARHGDRPHGPGRGDHKSGTSPVLLGGPVITGIRAALTDLAARSHDRLAGVRDALTPGEWARAGAMTGVIIGLHIAGWGMLAAAAGGHYHLTRTQIFGAGTGILAYTLGMRHAFDADHIAAIDNTTRKLAGEGKRPLSTGFFFSLGHCSIVFALAVLLNVGIRALDSQVKNSGSGLHAMTGIIGTGVSGTFLYLLAALNLAVLAGLVTVFRDMRGGACDDAELEEHLAKRGLMNRVLGPLARRVDTPWKMYPIGVLFGLGFDTATEVALLVLAGSAVATGLPFYAILSLPVLFAAGMCLFDTADGCFMTVAYDWAFARPVRKVYYNLTITALSVFAAFFIGTVEILGLIAQEYRLGGGFWAVMGTVDINKAGFVVAGVFALTWAVALAVWHFGKIEKKWDTAKPASD